MTSYADLISDIRAVRAEIEGPGEVGMRLGYRGISSQIAKGSPIFF